MYRVKILQRSPNLISAKVIDDNTIKEEDVRRTLEKVDTNNLLDIDELAQKLNEITEQTKRENAEKSPLSSSSFTHIFTKPTPRSPEKINEDKDRHFIKDDVSFLD